MKTVEALNRLTLKPGDSVFFGGGRVFVGTVRISASGSEGHPVWIGSYGAGEATIDGGDSSGIGVVSGPVGGRSWHPLGWGRQEDG